MYTLTEESRQEIQKLPYKLITMEELSKFFPDRKVVTIGDFVTHHVITNGLYPDIAIYDGQTKRTECGLLTLELLHYDSYLAMADNPAGEITTEMWHEVTGCSVHLYAPDQHRFQIKVNGEEDLCIFPAIIALPEGTIILYGIPGVGMAFIEVNRVERMNAIDILDGMIR